jgi:hypothetical protein
MIRLVLSHQDFQTIMKALGSMPLSEAFQAFVALQRQVAEQQQMDQLPQRAGPPGLPKPPDEPPAPAKNGAGE